MLVIDDSGDRKDGTKTAHVGQQYLGRYGKTDNGVVTVTTVWADERLYYPVHAVPYTPARHFAKGKSDLAFRTSWPSARRWRSGHGRRGSRSGRWSRIAYGVRTGSAAGFAEAGLPFVMALRPRRGTWARAADAHTRVEAARALAWGGPDKERPRTARRGAGRDATRQLLRGAHADGTHLRPDRSCLSAASIP